MQIEAHEVLKIRERMNAPLETREIMPTRAEELWLEFRGELNVILNYIREKSQSYDEAKKTDSDESHKQLFRTYKMAQETLDEEWQSFLSKINNSELCLRVATALHEALKNKTAPTTFVDDAVKQWIGHVKKIWYNFLFKKRQRELEKWKQDGFDSLEEAWKKFAVQLEVSPQQFVKILAEAKRDPNPIFRRFVNALCENQKNLENTVPEWIKRSQSLWNNYRKWTKLYPAAEALADVKTASLLTSMHDDMELVKTLVDLPQLTLREETAYTLASLEQLIVEREKQENMIQSRLTRQRSSAEAAKLMIESMSKKFKADSCSLRAHRQNAQNEIDFKQTLAKYRFESFESESDRTGFFENVECMKLPAHNIESDRERVDFIQKHHIVVEKATKDRKKKPCKKQCK